MSLACIVSIPPRQFFTLYSVSSPRAEATPLRHPPPPPSGAGETAALGEPVPAPEAPQALDIARDEGQIQFSVEGGVFPQATSFDIRSEAMHAVLSRNKLTVMHRRSENDWLSQDGQGLLRQLVFTLDLPPEPGTYDTTQYAMTFGMSPNPEGLGVKSIRTRGEAGTLTIISRTEDHITGSFDVSGRATQMHSTDPVYRIHGTFTFGRGR